MFRYFPRTNNRSAPSIPIPTTAIQRYGYASDCVNSTGAGVGYAVATNVGFTGGVGVSVAVGIGVGERVGVGFFVGVGELVGVFAGILVGVGAGGQLFGLPGVA